MTSATAQHLRAQAPRMAKRGLAIQLRAPGVRRPVYELRLNPGPEYPTGLGSVAHEVESVFRSLYPAYEREMVRRQMRDDPLYAAYEKARVELATAYPDVGVPMHVL